MLTDAVDELDSVVFQDVKISEHNPRGLFSVLDNKVYLRMNHEIFIQHLDQSTVPSTGLIHEMGHVVDVVLLNDTSKSARFNAIYEEEKIILPV
ncbi:hypothetical protein [Paenibacillus larvae]|uniref:hypothetical protein n=1 Tax=Paenibacillus larvae TaxID=1464 RepID=UPI00288CBDC6|nr:hypothetical protein [Paenibacillus larvae]MDT2192796.1 hypothetical protein [Paenibacillus larvae]MDT2236024.1 hypothetical protein [Paenibacillus larvae]MDT2286707.1 hypothetical protein [Paenibacillus larvae]